MRYSFTADMNTDKSDSRIDIRNILNVFLLKLYYFIINLLFNEHVCSFVLDQLKK